MTTYSVTSWEVLCRGHARSFLFASLARRGCGGAAHREKRRDARKVGICVQGQSCFGRGFFYHGPPRCILQQLCSLVSFADCTDHHIPNREWSHKEPLHQRQRSVGGCYLAFTTEKMSLLLHAIMVFKSWTTNLCKWFLFFCFSVAVFKVGIYNATK